MKRLIIAGIITMLYIITFGLMKVASDADDRMEGEANGQEKAESIQGTSERDSKDQ